MSNDIKFEISIELNVAKLQCISTSFGTKFLFIFINIIYMFYFLH